MNNNTKKCKEGCGSTQRCYCYANKKSTDPTRDQVCGRIEGDKLVLCDAGCCNHGKGCPGLCDIPSQDPDKLHPDAPLVDKIIALRDKSYRGIPYPVWAIIIFYILMTYASTMALLFRKSTKKSS